MTDSSYGFGKSFSKNTLKKILGIISFLIFNFLLYKFYEVFPKNHHIVEAAIQLDHFVSKKEFSDYFQVIHSLHVPLHYFLAFALSKIFNMTGMSAFIYLTLVQVNFFFFCIYFVLTRSFSSLFDKVIFAFLFLFLFKIVLFHILTMEDNLSYYGLLVLGGYYFSQSYRGNKQSIIAGGTLSLASCFYTSQILHVLAIFPVALVGLCFRRHRKLLKPVGIIASIILFIYGALFSFLFSRHHLDLGEVLMKIVQELKGKSSFGSSGVLYSFLESLKDFFLAYEGYTDIQYILVILLLIFLFFHLFVWIPKNCKLYEMSEWPLFMALIGTFLLYIIFYGPLISQRWGTLAILFLLYIVWCYKKSTYRYKTRILFLALPICLISINRAFSTFPKTFYPGGSCEKEVYDDYFFKELREFKNQDIVTQYEKYLFPFSYLLISHHIYAQLSVSPEDVYFMKANGKVYRSQLTYQDYLGDVFPAYLKYGEEKQRFMSSDEIEEWEVQPPKSSSLTYRSSYLRKLNLKCQL